LGKSVSLPLLWISIEETVRDVVRLLLETP
jgi:hypothetical protein